MSAQGNPVYRFAKHPAHGGVDEMTVSPEGLSLVSSMISLAHSLSLKVVAEGVETADQSQFLRLMRCDEMQGSLYSKPVPGDIFESKFLAQSPGG